MPVIVLVADGVRPDTLRSAIDSGSLPALARLEADGGLYEVTSTFPSVTGPAYTPFLMGMHPGSVGIPGLRWFDRSRERCRLPGHSRSYVGPEMGLFDGDIDPKSPTIFELVPSSVAALSIVTRGLAQSRLVGRSASFATRSMITHWKGDVRGWLDIDRLVARRVLGKVRKLRPDFVFAAFTGVDKASHAEGHESDRVLEALQIVDRAAADLRLELERSEKWSASHLWIVSDHGHTPIAAHEDLVDLMTQLGHAPMAHPWVFKPGARTAVMVSGNAMAHLYLDLDTRMRRWWPSLAGEWNGLVSTLLAHESVDLVLLPHGEGRCEVRTRLRGSAMIDWSAGRYRCSPITGDPLGVGQCDVATDAEAHERALDTEYPDSLVQIARLASCARSGDVILSAAHRWDLRARYEPIPHVSSHGALHREHMMVPLLLSSPPRSAPRRTVDVMPSALAALSVQAPALEGSSFL